MCVDAGAGLERLAMVLQSAPSIHEIDIYSDIFNQIDTEMDTVSDTRILFDHLKTSLLLADSGVYTANKGMGYVLRRLLRKSFGVAEKQGIDSDNLDSIVGAVRDVLPYNPGQIDNAHNFTSDIINSERINFNKIMVRANKLLERISGDEEITAKELFDAITSKGIPADLIKDAYLRSNLDYPETDVDRLLVEHRARS